MSSHFHQNDLMTPYPLESKRVSRITLAYFEDIKGPNSGCFNDETQTYVNKSGTYTIKKKSSCHKKRSLTNKQLQIILVYDEDLEQNQAFPKIKVSLVFDYSSVFDDVISWPILGVLNYCLPEKESITISDDILVNVMKHEMAHILYVDIRTIFFRSAFG
ncbi:unnamed protein product [Schistosoma bovis]|nr:unnamed protein product [Schistosoma bovis]